MASNRLIKGKVVDAQSGAPIAKVNIVCETPENIGTASNEDGTFSLRISVLPARSVGHPTYGARLRFSHIAYHEKTVDLSESQRDTTLVIELKIRSLPSQEIEIEAQQDNPEPATFRLRTDEIRDIPDFSNEALNAVKTLPGIASRNELQNSYQVQGGSSDENLIVLDGIEISRPQRVRSSMQENLSQLNSMLIENMTFTTGGFPARYGERLSSVLFAEYRDSSPEKFSGDAEISLLNAGLLLEGQPHAKLYWAAAARVADRELILKTLETTGDISPKAHDFQWIANYQISRQHQLKLFGVFGENDFAFEPERRVLRSNLGGIHSTTFEGFEKFKRRTKLVSLQLTSHPGNRLSVNNIFALGQFEELENVDITSETRRGPLFMPDTLVSRGSIFRENRLDESMLQYQGSFSRRFTPHLELDAGVQFVRRKFDDFLHENEQETPTLPDSLRIYDGYSYSFSGESAVTTQTSALYSSIRYRFCGNFELTTGLRFSRYTPANETVIQPRLSLSWNMSDFTKFKFSAGRYSQPPHYREFKDTKNAVHLDTKSQKATHVIAGVQHFKNTGSEYQLQLFYKNIDHYIPYRIDDIFIQYQPELQADARVYGFSFYWKGNVIPRISSWISYSYLKGIQNIQGEGKSPLPTDQRHTFSAVFQDNMPQFPRSRAHIRIFFGSGYPYTPVGTKVDEETGRRFFADLKRNLLRVRLYRRIDVGFSYTFSPFENTEARAGFEVFNILDYANILAYDAVIDGLGNASYLPIYLTRRLYNVKIQLSF